MNGYIENKTFDEIEIGDTASIEHTLTRKDIDLFAIMSGDVNPAHVDEEYAQSDMFHKIIAHGMWSGSFISTVLGTQLPGPGTIYLNQTFQFLKPVAIGDTITARVIVKSKKKTKNIVTLDCLCVNQNGKEVIKGEAVVIAPTEKVSRKRIRLPDIKLSNSREECPNYHRIICMAAGHSPIKTAVVHPVDANSLKGAIASAEEGLIEPILVGPEAKIRDIAKKEKLDISKYRLVPTEHSHAAAEIAVLLARRGEVEALMKGKIHTDELLLEVIKKDTGLRTGRRVSHVVMADIPAYPKPLFITDAAINIKPTLSDKKDIVQNAIDLFHSLDFGTPRVAIISAIETVNEKIPSTLDATALCKMAERGQITGALLDGPLAFDNAVSVEAAKVKNIRSQVAGKADILVVPDLESGNILLKQLTLFSGASVAGVVMGAKVPIILTSRSSGELARKASSALALLYIHGNNIKKLKANDIN
ncbi:MAG: bifunctional enoyl-CoA hydratase/phosphate acetyltransferase [Rickettsiales bacterium]|nr:bifunctional enoyl-CoA hydratase/phosphate acetyltransferase [Pseudomonadota bacterium]MDA0966379.1 bifunctional enoyl-CoA hydratase/phosphate acetyltransferase [Pseudomonadota bacterium]MDG4544012.1 bifunctional enoyl-CoA hydratase/phosphate acetyltransferase [Rickettsiales bacterium]MDG4545506.1 bifunctional enoyl-CoA hydratase/phosphate acetyltransferase [Rickettsiales bacterium]MDG4547955.1 bifunctional enoyl-CoA hydratase/phosphate acetyltransferase [Rickettsiales bacterium]